MMKANKTPVCPCGSRTDYQHCCERYIAGTFIAPDAQALMQSRYTAYTLEDEAYLLKTWHVIARPEKIIWQQEPVKWIGLTVLAHHQQEHNAMVEFIARYKVHGRAEKLHEKSRFVFEDGQWFYVDGDFLS